MAVPCYALAERGANVVPFQSTFRRDDFPVFKAVTLPFRHVIGNSTLKSAARSTLLSGT